MKTLTVIMMLFGFLATSFAIPGALSEGLSSPSGGGLPHPVVPMVLTGTIGEHEVQLNGSIQEIHAQMKVLYPNFDADALTPAKNLTARNTNLQFRSELEARGGKLPPPLCFPVGNWGWSKASGETIGEGINYLDQVQALCGVSARSCVRISCSWNSAIYLCNDNYYGITPTCPYMASYAQDIINDCTTPADRVVGDWSVCGQLFDSDGYNIIVRWDAC